MRAPFTRERKELPGLQPSPEAVAWGKRQASGSPRWTEAKWNRIGTLLGVRLAAGVASAEYDQAADEAPDDRAETHQAEPSTLRDVA